MRRAVLLAVSCALVLGSAPATDEGIRTPAFAPDGRVAVSIAGSLWVLHPLDGGGWGRPVQVTRGAAWDRDPAWTADGRALVFSSDRAGSIDLWRVDFYGSAGAEPVVTRLTRSPEHDLEPTVGPDGTIVFTRGVGGDSDLWALDASGSERRITSEAGPEREPALSPDGRWVAYTAPRGPRRELRIRNMVDGSETVVTADRGARSPSWAPDGQRLVFAATSGEPGVWVVGADGRYLQPMTTEPATPAWSSDGEWILLAAPDPGDGGYNGDPDRLGERSAGDILRRSGGLQRVAAPAAPAATATPLSLPLDRPADRNAEAYDRVWTRVARLYYGLPGEDGLRGGAATGSDEPAELAEWRRIGLEYRGAALAAADEEALEDAIWRMVSARPVGHGAVGRAGVSSAHPLASAAGVEILELGGNVVDAAVAVSFALSVVEPDASGIGGYGEMLIHVQGLEEPAAIEFSTRLPAAATLGNPAVDTLPRSGAGVAIVPGVVAGMERAWREHGSGSVPWARLVEPAIRLAEQGFEVSDGFATTLRRERAAFEASPGAVALYFRDGQPLAAGDTLRNADQAWTLRQVAEHGADAFYRGEVARRMVADLAEGGNVMTLADLASYTAERRRPVRASYRGNDVFSGPPPITGGAQLVGKLNLLELTESGGPMTEDAGTLHALIEAWKLQPPTGGRIGDPDLWPVDVTPFESKDTAAVRWRCFDPSQASAPNAVAQENCGRGEATSSPSSSGFGSVPGLAGMPELAATGEECLMHDRDCRGSGTTAFVVADADGNIVSVTQTLGTWGGNFHVTPGLGFLYNDKLRSYGSNPDAVNSRRPGARTTTVIAPTIVFRGTGAERRPWFGVGAAGNAWITAAVYQVVTGIVDHGLTAQQALELPRILAGGRVMQVEQGFSPAMLRQLEAMGHQFQPISLMGELRMGYGAAVLVGDGVVEAGGDPRRSGHGAVAGAAANDRQQD